jgi:hypothetical protein
MFETCVQATIDKAPTCAEHPCITEERQETGLADSWKAWAALIIEALLSTQ